ncbi:hypothetical protein RJ639_027589 [Escallonia herrerae]|uniref:Uncharacterized protein n=1 Tax=Escallonia herrerae TaxID=1293975 RepID=A0AA88X734_9ASTE|nr:hypothetical protein RJ639_027589 [Escallonia herrerae]
MASQRCWYSGGGVVDDSNGVVAVMVQSWSWLMVLVGGGGYGFAIVVVVGNGFARSRNLLKKFEEKRKKGLRGRTGNFLQYWLTSLRGGWAKKLEKGREASQSTNILEAHIQVQSLLVSEYTSEEIQSVINMVSIQVLQAKLDNLLQVAC